MIHSVEMINWRAYEKREFKLEPGITFLMGSNGTGKTSILEAICYGLTGEAAMFDAKSRSKLLRIPERDATVNLTFEIGDKQYRVSRSQSSKAAAGAELKRLGDGKILGTNHSQCTRQISKLLGVSPEFLQRIVYMAEGDVFRFISKPPGDALEEQIRQVLGLTQLDQFTEALDKSGKQINQRMSALQELSDDLGRLDIHTRDDLQGRVNAGESTRSLLLKKLEDNRTRINEAQSRFETHSQLREWIVDFESIPTHSSDQWSGLAEMPFLVFFTNLEQTIENFTRKLQELAIQKARLEGERQAQSKILIILEPYEDRLETLPCPVCKKLMTETERHSILSDLRGTDAKTLDEVEALQRAIELAEKDLLNLQSGFDSLKKLRNAIVHGNPGSFNTLDSFTAIKERVVNGDGKQAELNVLETQRQEIQDQIGQLQTLQADFLAVQRRLSEFGFAQPEEVKDSLVALEIRSLSLRSANQASQQTLVAQRNSDMESIYNQIARLWGTFTGEDEWQIALDGKGLPTLENDLGQRFDLHQLSGGEKTALMIMLHTIIAHHFSQSDFIMVDEPLEHLDPVNRRSLIRFLVQSYRRGLFKQAIIATFEESLIRKYMSEDGVNVVMI